MIAKRCGGQFTCPVACGAVACDMAEWHGSNRAPIGQTNLGNLGFFSCFSYRFFIIYIFWGGVILFQNGELMIPDRLGYILNDFGNFQNLIKIWTRRPPNYYQNASTIQDNLGNILETYYLCQYGIQQNPKTIKKLCVLSTICFSFCLLFLSFSFVNFVLVNIWVHIFKIFRWRWGLKND